MEKYGKLFKGLEMCAGPDCNPECPYHGETRGGKTCRAWLLNDAAAALATGERRAENYESENKCLHERVEAQKKRINDLMMMQVEAEPHRKDSIPW